MTDPITDEQAAEWRASASALTEIMYVGPPFRAAYQSERIIALLDERARLLSQLQESEAKVANLAKDAIDRMLAEERAEYIGKNAALASQLQESVEREGRLTDALKNLLQRSSGFYPEPPEVRRTDLGDAVIQARAALASPDTEEAK